MNTPHPFRLVVVSALAVVTLSACVVAPLYSPEQVVVAQPPPQPYAEVVPVAPYAGAIWINGSWGWSRNRYEWGPGRYERPRPGYRWRPHHWRQQPRGGWSLEGGVWGR